MKSSKEIDSLKKKKLPLLLKVFLMLFVPVVGFVFYGFIVYPLQPHCSLGTGLLGCTPFCEPTAYFKDGRPSAYKKTPCSHDDPGEFQVFLYHQGFLFYLILFILLGVWIYKRGPKLFFKELLYVAVAPIFLFKENRKNTNIASRLLVIVILFFLFIEWVIGYFVVFKTIN